MSTVCVKMRQLPKPERKKQNAACRRKMLLVALPSYEAKLLHPSHLSRLNRKKVLPGGAEMMVMDKIANEGV
jgi:hypothetical protein